MTRGRKRQEREHQELLALLQGLVGKRIYRSTCLIPAGLSAKSIQAYNKLNLPFDPVTLMAVDSGRLFIRIDRVGRDEVKHLLGQIISLPESFTDDAWTEWPIGEEQRQTAGARLVFGEGKIAVTTGIQDGKHILMLEEGLGAGTIGQSIPGRQPGCEPIPGEIVDEAVVLEFSNEESLQVVIDALEQIRADMRKKATMAKPEPLG